MKKAVKISPYGRAALKAFRRAVAKVWDENRKLGIPVAVMKNGRAVLLPVEEALALERKKRRTEKAKARRRSHIN